MIEDKSVLRGSLVLDSWADAGPRVRSRSIEDRHLIYEGGGVILDLVLKQSVDGPIVSVGGQVLPESDSMDGVSDIPIIIESGGGKSSTRTNRIGEFALKTTHDKTLDITILLRDRRFQVRGLTWDPKDWQFNDEPQNTSIGSR